MLRRRERKENGSGKELVFLSRSSNKVSGWSHRHGKVTKGTELERSQQMHHLKKTAVFMDFAITEASGKTACWELLDQIEIPEVAEAGCYSAGTQQLNWASCQQFWTSQCPESLRCPP